MPNMTFLSAKSQAVLDELFHLRYSVRWKEKSNHFNQAGKKFLIPLGYQRLKVHKIDYQKASNGSDMLVIEFWKQPEYLDGENYRMKDKPTYKTITCYHLVQDYSDIKLSVGWFKSFTTCYTKPQLDQLFKYRGKWFMAIVNHIGDTYNDNEFFKSEITEVYRDGHELDYEIDYFTLFKPLKK